MIRAFDIFIQSKVVKIKAMRGRMRLGSLEERMEAGMRCGSGEPWEGGE